MRTLLRKLRWLAHRRRKEAELEAELAFHLAEETEEAKARGMSEPDARLAAQRHLGNCALVFEDTRDVWGWTWLEHVFQDLRFAGRLLRRRPVLSATAIITLVLGIGGTTAVFSLLDALLVKELPVVLFHLARPSTKEVTRRARKEFQHIAIGETGLTLYLGRDCTIGAPTLA